MATNPNPVIGGVQTPAPRLIDEYSASAYLAVSVQTVRRMRARRARGEMGPTAGPAYVRVASAVRYDQRDLDSYVDALPRAGGGRAA